MNAPTSSSSSSAALVVRFSTLAGKYLTVMLAGETCAISVMRVREIIRMQKITPVAGMPAHVKGVINLRGRVTPIIDLREKLGLAAELTEKTCVILVLTKSSSEQLNTLGFIVNSVEEIVSITADEIKPTHTSGTRVSGNYLLGIAGDIPSAKLLLDIDRIVDPEPVT